MKWKEETKGKRRQRKIEEEGKGKWRDRMGEQKRMTIRGI